jgi:hypothetical protein
MLQKAYIPYGGYYSSPFSRWQGTMANDNSITLGAATGLPNAGSKIRAGILKYSIISFWVLPSTSRMGFMADLGPPL